MDNYKKVVEEIVDILEKKQRYDRMVLDDKNISLKDGLEILNDNNELAVLDIIHHLENYGFM